MPLLRHFNRCVWAVNIHTHIHWLTYINTHLNRTLARPLSHQHTHNGVLLNGICDVTMAATFSPLYLFQILFLFVALRCSFYWFSLLCRLLLSFHFGNRSCSFRQRRHPFAIHFKLVGFAIDISSHCCVHVCDWSIIEPVSNRCIRGKRNEIISKL